MLHRGKDIDWIERGDKSGGESKKDTKERRWQGREEIGGEKREIGDLDRREKIRERRKNLERWKGKGERRHSKKRGVNCEKGRGN